MLNGTYHVVGFDGSTTIAEFLQTLNLDIGCRGIELSGFTIFSDDPIEKNMDHCLSQKDKVYKYWTCSCDPSKKHRRKE